MRKLLKGLEFHKTGFRALKVVHKIDSTMIPAAILDVAVQTAAVYGSLFLTAALIDDLLERNFYQAMVWAVAVILLNALTGIVNSFLKRLYAEQEIKCGYSFYAMLREKAMSLDYEKMENPELVDKILVSERAAQMYGGVGKLVGYYQQIGKSLLSMAASLGMIFVLCLKRPQQGGAILEHIISPGCSLLLFGLLFLLNCILAGKISARFSEILEGYFKNHAGVEIKLGYLMNRIFLNYRTGKIIRIYDMKEMLLKNAIGEVQKVRNFYEESSIAGIQEDMSYLLINSLFSLFSYLLVAMKVVTRAVSVGAFTQYTGALNQFGSAYTTLVQTNGQVRNCCTYIREFLEFLELESLHASGTIPVEKRLDGEYEFAFEDVSFHYPGNTEMVLEHVTCKLDMKHKMAVVGQNGAGKTTFIKLLCRLYEPTQGRITLNGVDIRKYDEEQYRDLLSVVFQDFKLFAFPVRDNLAAGYAQKEEKLWEALRQAGADERVRCMPQGLDTWLYKDVEDGVEISGGEAQKLALARALYKDAALVILDEPTAALDPMAEAEVYAGFDRMVEGKTSIYISHRMSSCRFCDDIIVFDRGKIVERGSHEALLEANGQYARLWNAQAKYYA